jgi:hypothetical protein
MHKIHDPIYLYITTSKLFQSKIVQIYRSLDQLDHPINIGFSRNILHNYEYQNDAFLMLLFIFEGGMENVHISRSIRFKPCLDYFKFKEHLILYHLMFAFLPISFLYFIV